VAAATLAGTGVGGGGLYVIWLTAVSGMAQKDAQVLNLLFFVAASTAALPYHARHRKMSFALSAAAAVFGIAGACLGGRLKDVMSDGALRCAFGIFLVVSGFLSFFRRKKKGTSPHRDR
ncbi:MAG: sulfite exporter TauE/SafE family protein, partial [Clostridia bacterium]|nr:sulfite exporter TauE/SafE family protein [Clostridia bacterium]